jgi:hypothetical protein
MSLGASLFFLATASAGLIFLGTGLIARMRPFAQVSAPEPVDLDLVLDAISGRVEAAVAQMIQHQQTEFAALRADMTALKSDVDWLAGERMIEQAIAMAQTGLSADDISMMLDLPRDAAETITLLARH